MRSIIKIGILVALSIIYTFSGVTVFGADHFVTPEDSIQEAINASSSGDTIYLEDGQYYQQINVNKTVTIKAVNPGMATLTGGYKGSLQFNNESSLCDETKPCPNLYSVQVPWEVSWAMINDHSLLNYVTLAKLKTLELQNMKRLPTRIVYYGVKADGFAYENGKLYVRLLDGRDPTGLVTVNRDMSSASTTPGVGINVSASDAVVEGLRLKLWDAYGIDVISSAQNVSIRHCSFSGVYRGIRGYNNPRGLTVTNNEFSLSPVYDIRRSDSKYDMWEVLYDSNLGGVFLRAIVNGATINNNYVHDSFDGIEVKGATTTGATTLLTDIGYNVVQNIVDNPLEFDTAKRFMRARVHNNFLLDAYTWVSLAPFQAGFITVDHNIFYMSPERGMNFSRWFKPCYYQGADETVKLRNMTLVHNTVVLGDSGGQSSELYTPCNEGDHYENSIMENNILLIKTATKWRNFGMVFSEKNLLYGTNANIPDIAELNTTPDFLSTSPNIDFHLSAGSAAINAGINKDSTYFHNTQGDGTELGAIEYGDTWTMPRPGPAWAVGDRAPWRPEMPASLNAVWVGLGSYSNASGLVTSTSSGLSYNRFTKLFNGKITLTNASQQNVSGPLHLVLTNLSSSATLINAEGTFQGSPYVTVQNINNLSLGASVSVPVQFAVTSNERISYTLRTYSGSLQ